jgi:hypothetical protein
MPTPTLSEERTGLSLPEKLIHPAGEWQNNAEQW